MTTTPNASRGQDLAKGQQSTGIPITASGATAPPVAPKSSPRPTADAVLAEAALVDLMRNELLERIAVGMLTPAPVLRAAMHQHGLAVLELRRLERTRHIDIATAAYQSARAEEARLEAARTLGELRRVLGLDPVGALKLCASCHRVHNPGPCR